MKKEVINPTTVAQPAAPYSTIIKVKGAENLIFCAGVAPSDINGTIVCRGDIAGQTKQVVKNIITILEAAGAKQENIVMTTTYVVESAMKSFLETGSSVDCLLSLSKPTDTLIGVACLAGSEQGQLIEVTALAVTG